VRGLEERPDGLAQVRSDGLAQVRSDDSASLGQDDSAQVRSASSGRGQSRLPPKLLGSFDPVLLGWASRDDVVGEYRSLVTVNGIFRPFVMVAGRAVGTWGLPDGPGGAATMELFEPISPTAAGVLEREVADVRRFLTS
jgi:hypothetical protein